MFNPNTANDIIAIYAVHSISKEYIAIFIKIGGIKDFQYEFKLMFSNF